MVEGYNVSGLSPDRNIGVGLHDSRSKLQSIEVLTMPHQPTNACLIAISSGYCNGISYG